MPNKDQSLTENERAIYQEMLDVEVWLEKAAFDDTDPFLYCGEQIRHSRLIDQLQNMGVCLTPGFYPEFSDVENDLYASMFEDDDDEDGPSATLILDMPVVIDDETASEIAEWAKRIINEKQDR